MQSPVCPPNELLSFGEILQYTMYQVFTKFQMSVKKTLHREIVKHIALIISDLRFMQYTNKKPTK